MEGEDEHKMPLHLENDQYVLTPIINKSSGERALSDISSASNRSSISYRHQEVQASGTQKNESSENKSNKSVPSTSSAGTKEKHVTAVKKKKKKLRYQNQFLCVACKVRMDVGDLRCHILGKQHRMKAVPLMSPSCSITVWDFNPDTTEKTLFDYFSTFGPVKTVFIYRREGLFAVIEFMKKCSVQHTTEYYALYGRYDLSLTVIKGLPSKNGHTAGSEAISSAVKSTAANARARKEKCRACGVELRLGQCREHYLSRQHTQKAYFKLKESHCVTVKGFSKDPKVRALYDYFSRAGRVVTLILFREKVLCAVVEYSQICSVGHVTKCLVPQKLRNCRLVVSAGKPFGGHLPNMPAFLEDKISLENLDSQPDEMKNVAKDSKKANKGDMNGCPEKQKEKEKVARNICSVCSAVYTARDRRSHFLGKSHIKKTVPCMKESSCVTVVGCPATVTKEELYDYFNFYENVQTIDMRKSMEGLVVIEFESQCPLKDFVDRINTLVIGTTTVTVIRGFSSIDVAAQGSTVSHDERKCYQQEKTVVASHSESRSTSSAGRTLDSLIKNELESAMKALCMQESSVKTSTENSGASSMSNSTPSDEVINNSTPGNKIINKSPAPNNKVLSESSATNNEIVVASHSESRSTSSAGRTLDSLIKNELESAMKALRMQESSVKTSTENSGASSMSNSTPSDEVINNSTPGDKIINKSPAPNNKVLSESSATNNEIKEEPKLKRMMCDFCNTFLVTPDEVRQHHIGKKHNENALKLMSVQCSICVTGYPKGCIAENLYDYFSQFGKVKAVIIPKRKKRGALVGFYSEKSAHRVANSNGNLVLKNSLLSVKLGYPSLYARGKPMESLPPHDDLMSSLQNCKTVESQISCLQSSLLLSKENIEARISLCNSVTEILREFFPHCVLHLFGSSVNSFGLKGSDVDILFEAYPDESGTVGKEEFTHKPKLKVEIPSLRDVKEGRFSEQSLAALPKVGQLDFIKKALRKGSNGFHTVIFVSSATCPIVKFISRRYALSCDLSNGNRLSLCNTALLKTFGMLDNRVIPLVTALRYWAKKFNYISLHNFSSYAFTLMVIFFLQTREPHILPSVEFLRSYADKKIEVAGIDCSFCSDVGKIVPSANCETIENLLFEFFNHYGKFDYSKFVISPLTGCCEPIEQFKCNDPSVPQVFKVGAVCIQDPFLVNRNVSSFLKEESLGQMVEHMRKITKERYDYYQNQQKKSQNSAESAIWGIPELFEVIPKVLKSRQLHRHSNPFTLVKIILDEVIMNSVKKKYGINCTQCNNLSEIAVQEVCCSAIDVMNMLLFVTEITVDERNHCEWALKAKSLSFSCTCAESHSTDEDLSEACGSSSDLSPLDEGLAENCLEGRSSASQVSDAGQFSGEEDNWKTVSVDVLDTQGSASTKVPENFNVSKYKPFLSLGFTVVHQTWVSRKAYRKQCNSEDGVFEIEKCVSQKIAQVKSLELKEPAKFRCEFYDYYGYANPVLYLKVIPPDKKRCWKPVTSFLQDYLPKMIRCSLGS